MYYFLFLFVSIWTRIWTRKINNMFDISISIKKHLLSFHQCHLHFCVNDIEDSKINIIDLKIYAEK
jgi:hypothetical protein